MQKSFHVNKDYEYLLPFLKQQKNISKYICELIASDYSNQTKCLESVELANLISSKILTTLELKWNEELEMKMDLITKRMLRTLVHELSQQPVAKEKFASSFLPPQEQKRSSIESFD